MTDGVGSELHQFLAPRLGVLGLHLVVEHLVSGHDGARLADGISDPAFVEGVLERRRFGRELGGITERLAEHVGLTAGGVDADLRQQLADAAVVADDGGQRRQGMVREAVEPGRGHPDLLFADDPDGPSATDEHKRLPQQCSGHDRGTGPGS
jgi:hypothetical protein